MFNVIVCGICAAIWVIVGFVYYFAGCSNKQELRITPFPASVSWLMFAMILVQCLVNFAGAITLIGGK